MGSFASGVTVITSGAKGEFHAMTASAFSSVSAEPPLVLVCVDRKAESAGIISEHKSFGVNILESDQVALSNGAARRGTPESSLEGVEFSVGEFGLPLIAGCMANFECRTVHEYDGGDHIIYVGEIVSGYVATQGEPLLYFRGKYGGFTPQQT